MTATIPLHRAWYSGVTRYQWLVLVIACLGWIFDAFEGQVFVVSMHEAMPALLPPGGSLGNEDFYNDLGFAAFLVGGAVGGLGFGVLSDRMGRVRTMMFTILCYSAFTSLSAFSQVWWQMVALRFFVAMGVGGEWAVASAMVAEVFPEHARSTSQGIFHGSSVLGVLMAVAVGAWVVPTWGWRWAFGVGLLPALLTIWIYASLREPEQWIQARAVAAVDRSRRTGRLPDLFKADLLRSTLVGLALATIGLATFWGVFVRGQSLMRERAEDARIGRQLDPQERRLALNALSDDSKSSIKQVEMLAMLAITVGGGIGMLCFAPIANRCGRRGAFLVYCLGGTAVAVLVFKVLPQQAPGALWWALPVFGFFTTGIQAGFAVYFPELFPTRLRGTGGGFCFNGGRLLAAPILVLNGVLRDRGISLADSGAALGLLFLLGVVVLWFAPETKGRALPA